MAAAPRHVLDGIKALDFTQFVAGPTVTKLMAEMGAEVIKVEVAPDGDRCRTVSFVKNNRSGYFVQQNRGKLSLCLDVRRPEAKEILRGLIPKVDVIVENFAPGVIKRMGFDYETVKAINPKIVMCSVSTFGQTGPLSNDPGYDFVGQAYAGVTSLSGEADGPPVPADAGAGRRLDRRARARCDCVRALLSRSHWRGAVHRYFVAGRLFSLPRLGRANDQRERRSEEGAAHRAALFVPLSGRDVQRQGHLHFYFRVARSSLGQVVRNHGPPGTRSRSALRQQRGAPRASQGHHQGDRGMAGADAE